MDKLNDNVILFDIVRVIEEFNKHREVVSVFGASIRIDTQLPLATFILDHLTCKHLVLLANDLKILYDNRVLRVSWSSFINRCSVSISGQEFFAF
jgi:hypothetical protein